MAGKPRATGLRVGVECGRLNSRSSRPAGRSGSPPAASPGPTRRGCPAPRRAAADLPPASPAPTGGTRRAGPKPRMDPRPASPWKDIVTRSIQRLFLRTAPTSPPREGPSSSAARTARRNSLSGLLPAVHRSSGGDRQRPEQAPPVRLGILRRARSSGPVPWMSPPRSRRTQRGKGTSKPRCRNQRTSTITSGVFAKPYKGRQSFGVPPRRALLRLPCPSGGSSSSREEDARLHSSASR